MRDDAGCGHGFADVLGKRYATVAAVKFPGASVFAGQKILVAAFGFGKATGDGPHPGFRLIVCKPRRGATA
jgi:hypothetical protein